MAEPLSLSLWEDFRDWQLVCPPNRPPNYFVELCRAEIARLPHGSCVAILGCTPEFVDIANESGNYQVFVFDRSSVFYDFTQSVRYTASSEQFVLGGWIDTLSGFSNTFDLVLSDLTLGNLPYDQQEPFTVAVGASLSDRGVVIDRTLVNEVGMKLLSDLSPRYRLLPANLLNLNAFNAEFLFTSELVESRGVVHSSELQDYLSREFEYEKSPLKWFTANVHKITPRGAHWWYGRRWAEVSRNYFPGFKVATVAGEPSGSPYAGFARVHKIERKH